MKYRVISKKIIDDFVRYNWNKYTIKEIMEIMENAGFVTTFNNGIQDAKNFIYHNAIKTGNAYLIYRYYKHYGTYVFNIESKKLIKVF